MTDRASPRIPEYSIYTVLCGPIDSGGLPQPPRNAFEQRFRANGVRRLTGIAEWACRHIQEATALDVDVLMVRFAMTPIDPETPVGDVLREAKRIAKRFALEEYSQAA